MISVSDSASRSDNLRIYTSACIISLLLPSPLKTFVTKCKETSSNTTGTEFQAT